MSKTKLKHEITVINKITGEVLTVAKILGKGDAVIILQALQDAAKNSDHIEYKLNSK